LQPEILIETADGSLGLVILDLGLRSLMHASLSVSAAQARIERARRLLSESELRAPFDALILSRPGEPGMVISSQCQPAIVYSVARGDELIALARLEPGPAESLRPGGEAEVVVGEKPVKGRISGLSALPDGRYGLEVLIPRGAGMLAGQPASIRLP
jgi:multidrug resistance efflux pump